MYDDLLTTLTERGQTSLPASLRKQAKLKPGDKLQWQQISETEFRVSVANHESASGPLAALGYARKFKHGWRTTKEAMLELRLGEDE